jgi:hypothetical protein
MNGRLASLALCGMLAAGALHAQDQNPSVAQTTRTAIDEPAERRFSIGFRVRGFPRDIQGDRKTDRKQENPPILWEFNTTSSSPKVGIGLSTEFMFSDRFSLNLEALYHRLSYKKVTKIYEGTDNPNTGGDERSLTTVTEWTRATYWDVPLLFRYHGFFESRALEKLYFSFGGVARFTSNVRTSNETVFATGSSSYNEIPERPSKRTLPGVTAGIGWRFVDNFNLKVTPEARYTRWFGSAFSNQSTRADRNQIEVGIGITF